MRRMKVFSALVVTAIVGVPLSAHIMVSPPQSKAGVTQRYELRVHNEEKVAIKSVDLAIPEGISVATVGPAPSGTYTTAKTGDRITSITWTVDVAPEKYFALPFTAKNPSTTGSVSWVARAHLVDGTTVEWSDKPGAGEKASVTTFAAAAVAPASTQSGQMAKAPMSDADYVKAMKEIGPAFAALQRDNAAMSHEDGAKQAQLLSDRFKEVQAYWAAKNTTDAVKFSQQAVAAADATVKASAAMDMTSLTSAQQQLSASCTGCHTVHREKLADGTYKMK